MRPLFVSSFVLLCACGDTTLATYNTPPEVEITSPADGSTVNPSELIELKGVVRDGQQDLNTLDVFWTSSLDGDLGTSEPDSDGLVYLAITELTSGSHAITLTAIDDDGESEQDVVTVEVGFGQDETGEGYPTVIMLGPADGAEYLETEILTVVGTATDDEQAWDTLNASIVSDRDGTLWTGQPLATGGISEDLAGLSPGVHSLSLVVQDEDLHVADDSVTITIIEDGSPVVTVTSPIDGAEHYTDEEILLEGELSDDVTDATDLKIDWTSDVDGFLATGSPDSYGYTAAGVYLTEGIHVVTLAGEDADGNVGEDSVQITVIDPWNVDDDGDGQTENEGDCDDADSSTYTGATEVCDWADNDCDGDVNEDWLDSYESNDTSSAYYDLGEVDNGFLWAGDSLTISGLSANTEGDEDWFHFDADDEYYDNADFVVTFESLDATSSWVLELYNGSFGLEDSDSGTGKLQVDYSGDWFDDDEDHWYIRVYTTSWAGGSVCETTYSLDIDA